MTQLVLVLCLAWAPAVCREKAIPGAVYNTPIACAVQGQQDSQDYLADHPKWVLKGWRCGPAERGA